ncbi:MAG: hypothetical protein J5I50_07025 [Chitinophagaceae bacterium]|nr:hypothetical protein [Chitinophagaceae bacterium]
MEPTQSNRLSFLEKAVDIKYWIKSILRLWWAFLITAAIFGLGGLLFATLSPVKYKSHLTFAIDDGSKTSSGILNLASQLGLSMGTGSSVFSGDNILAILKSRKIVENVLLTSDSFSSGEMTFIEHYLIQTNFFKDGKNGDLHFPANIKREQLSYQQDSILKKVYKSFNKHFISVDRPDKRLSIYSLEVTSKSEEFAKKFTDLLMSQSNEFYTDLLSEKSKQTLNTLEEQAALMKENLNASISGKATAQDANLNPALSRSQIPITQQQTNIQVYGSAYAELFKNLEMARFQYLNARPIIQIIDEANYPMEKVKRGKLVTAVLFAFIGCLLLFLYLWLKRISVLSKETQQ